MSVPNGLSPLLSMGLFLYAAASGFSISLSQIGLGLAALGLIAEVWRGNLKPRWCGVDRSFLCLLVPASLSLLFAVDLVRGIGEMSKFLLLGVFWVTFWPLIPALTKRRLLYVLVGSGALAAVAGLVRTFVVEGLTYRTSGFYSMPLTFSECQMLYFLLTLVLLKDSMQPLKTRGLLALALVCNAAGLVGSFTRGAFIGLTFGLGVLFCRRLRYLLVGGAAVAGIVALAFLVAPALGRHEVLSFSSSSPDSLKNIRLTIWERGFRMLQIQPVFGIGMNNVKPRYRAMVSAKEVADNQVFGHLHSTFLQYLVMTGFLGFACFLWFILETGAFAASLPGNMGDVVSVVSAGAALPVWVAFLASGLTEYSFGDEEVAMLCFFLIGVLGSGARDAADQPADSSGAVPAET